MNPDTYTEESLSLLVIVDHAPDAEDELYVLHGQVSETPDAVIWRGSEGRVMPLNPDWRMRLRPVTEGLREMFAGAPHFLPVVIRKLADDDAGGIPLGWRLPQ